MGVERAAWSAQCGPGHARVVRESPRGVRRDVHKDSIVIAVLPADAAMRTGYDERFAHEYGPWRPVVAQVTDRARNKGPGLMARALCFH